MVNLERMFDLVCHMNESNADEPYEIVKGKPLNRKQQGRILKKSVQAFIHGDAFGYETVPNEKPRIIQAFSGSSDLPQLTKDVFNVVQTVPNFDTAWQAAFRGITLRKGQLNWEIADVASGIVFELVPEGEKCKFYSISGNIVTAGIAKYAAGIGVTWEMIEGRKLYQFIDMMMLMRAQLFLLWANIHYGLLGTAAATNAVAWQGVATDPIIDRDIGTINKGYETIGAATKDKGYGDVANAPMVIFASPTIKGRILRAMRQTDATMVGGRTAGASGSAGSPTMDYNVTPYFSWNTNVPANKALMTLPGWKNQNAVYMQELSLAEKDITTLSEMRSYWSAFGGIIADTDQHAELAFV